MISVDAGAVLVEALPVQGVEGDGDDGTQMRKIAPQSVTDAAMGRVQHVRLAAAEPFREIARVPWIQVADLRTLHIDDMKQMPGRDLDARPCRGGTVGTSTRIVSPRIVSWNDWPKAGSSSAA